MGTPKPRPDLLDVLPFADTADQDPDALPFGDEEPRGCPHLYRADWYGGRRCWCCQEVRPR